MNKKIYIEAGANDGIFQSRSLHLENNSECICILIEPIPIVFNRLKKNRSKAIHYNCALVDFDFQQTNISINIHSDHNAMCSIIPHSSQEYIDSVVVPARTLDSILEENDIIDIEYFYLDVEGYEFNVLKGINFNKRKFDNIEIECHYKFLGIHLKEEIKLHNNFLQQFGYKLITINSQSGNEKLIFKKN
jgi:FkbM family methyltransferase